MKHAIAALCFAAVLSASLSQTAIAQRESSMRLGIAADTVPTVNGIAKRPAADSAESKLANFFHGALIGSAVGAGAGLVGAFVATQYGGETDHSEDALAYIYMPAFGALIGYIVGGVVGLLHTRP